MTHEHPQADSDPAQAGAPEAAETHAEASHAGGDAHAGAAHARPEAGAAHAGAAHAGEDRRRAREQRALKLALSLLLAFMAAEIVAALIASSLALLADAAHMLTDAAALALALVAAALARRPARGAMTFGLGRAEILSAEANGMTMLVLALIIVYGAISHLVSPPDVEGVPVLVVALVGIGVNLVVTRMVGADHHDHRLHQPGGHQHGEDADGGAGDRYGAGEPEATERPRRGLNVEGSYQHLLTDLFAFIATAIAAAVIILTGFRRADAIASLLIAALMLRAAVPLIRASMRIMMEAAPAGLDPDAIGHRLAAQPGVTEVHDLHVWEVTSGFVSVSAHVVVDAGHDCHEVRRALSRLLADEFGLGHSTLQVEHARAAQAPLQIEVPSATES